MDMVHEALQRLEDLRRQPLAEALGPHLQGAQSSWGYVLKG